MAAAVEVVGVSKRFRLYREKAHSLKERVIHAGRYRYEELWALRDINLEIAEGETIGLLGHNGSGKSTLLKCIAAILQPTSGRILVRGQVGAMLELGAGFHPDLSGRDNIFLNASLLGVPRREVERRFDEIVAFAELEPFIDQQVKFYSSGMYTRLGFAVAVSLEPDVLLVDEVLAVGDESFQRKCIDRVRRFQAEGRTIVFVSHAPDLVRQICDSAIVLEKGRQLGDKMPPGDAIRLFREHLFGTGGAAPGGEIGTRAAPPVRITSVRVDHPRRAERPHLLPGEPLSVHVGFEAAVPVDDPVFAILVHDARGELVFGSDTEVLGQPVGPVWGEGEVVFHVEAVPLLDGTYGISLGVRGGRSGGVYDWRDHEAHFEVVNPGRTLGSVALPVRAELHAGPTPDGSAGHGSDGPHPSSARQPTSTA